MRTRCLRWLTCLAVFVLAVAVAHGQNFKATIVGQVTDPSGAAIPGATVTVIDEKTATEFKTKTFEDGSFTVPQLSPSVYTVKVEAPGFSAIRQTGLTLETGQTRRLPIQVQVATAQESVTITAQAPAVNTDISSKGEVIVQKQVEDLPLNGRNFQDLALLTPGVYKRPSDDDQGEGLSTAGTRTDATSYVLDGIVNRSDRNGAVGVQSSIESIQEFKVQTSTYSSEFGRNAGAQVVVVSKSGTNSFHGSLFEFLRNDFFDAKDYFPSPMGKKLRRNQYGGSLGGPVIKDKTFFFVSYEGQREVRSTSQARLAPAAAWLRGDFSALRGAGNNGIYGDNDDTNRVMCVTTTGTKVECPTRNVLPEFPVGNILGWNSISKAMLPFIPAANNPAQRDGYFASGVKEDNPNKFATKIDHHFTQSHTLSGRWAYNWGGKFEPFPSDRNFYPGFGRDVNSKSHNLAIADQMVFTPTLINELRFGIFDERKENLGQNRDKDWVAEFGITGLDPSEDMQGWPAVRIDGIEEFGDRPNDPFVYDLRNYQISDMVTWVKGTHGIKFGADLIRSNYVENDIRTVRGDFRFRGRNTNTGTGTSSGFRSFADFLLGLPDSTTRQVGATPANLTGWQYAFFFQDDWRVTPRLTVNLGLRYELMQALSEENNRIGNYIPELNEIVYPGDERYPDTLVKTDKNNWSPRLGFAWRPFGDDKTVIRGGAGIFYSLETFNTSRQQLANATPFVIRETYNRSAAQPLALSWQTPFPAALLSTSAQNVAGADVNNATPDIYQYNLTIERELLPDLALELGYVGSQGRHLGQRINTNISQPTGTVSACNNVTYTTGYTEQVCTAAAARPNATWGDIIMQYQNANSNYNALQASLRRRSKNGLTLLASYTYSRAIDDASSTNNSTTGSQKYPQDPDNLAAERGLSDFHRKHQFSASFNYELPFGRGRAFFGGIDGWQQQLFGGWNINGIVSLFSGRPFNPRFATANNSDQRPDLIGDPFQNVPEGYSYNPCIINLNNQPLPAGYTCTSYPWHIPVATAAEPDLYGNAGRNIMIGPDFKSVDFGVSKNFSITEGMKLQLRGEVFNLFNRPNFKIPGQFLDRSDAAQYRATEFPYGGPREMQLALKLTF